jgi:glycosyltransferase involved in cell wall biosynthesis
MQFRACAVVPSYQVSRRVLEVVRELRATIPELGDIVVVDDGSTDDTRRWALDAKATVLSHSKNLGKGAALRTGLRHAATWGFDVALTVDADGQHPASSARTVLLAADDPGALVLGVRDLVLANAPRANQRSNRISNFFLSAFSGRRILDTQCGLRRYPVARTLGLAPQADGYAFESEVLLRAIAAHVPIVEVPVPVVYPDESMRITHFDSVKDPARIVGTVVRTLIDLHGPKWSH